MKEASIFILLLLFACGSKSNSERSEIIDKRKDIKEEIVDVKYDNEIQTIHILVALCDNTYQGIVPVPKKIGNGQDPSNNLYWGTAYGIKTYFKRSKNWTFVKSYNLDNNILERIVFKHVSKDVYIIADAYDGKHIKETTNNFLKFSSGNQKEVITLNGKQLGIGGNANLIAYIGHDGLMDFEITEKYENKDNVQRDVIVLACYSKNYFEPHFQKSNINPLVWTTGLMAPEAYTIHDAITGYVNNESNEEIRIRAAKAYSKYQKCSLRAAKKILVTN